MGIDRENNIIKSLIGLEDELQLLQAEEVQVAIRNVSPKAGHLFEFTVAPADLPEIIKRITNYYEGKYRKTLRELKNVLGVGTCLEQ